MMVEGVRVQPVHDNQDSVWAMSIVMLAAEATWER